MTKQEFAESMIIYSNIWNVQFDSAKLNIWYPFFCEHKKNGYQIAIKQLAEKKTFAPSIAELLEEYKECKNGIEMNKVIELEKQRIKQLGVKL